MCWLFVCCGGYSQGWDNRVSVVVLFRVFAEEVCAADVEERTVEKLQARFCVSGTG